MPDFHECAFCSLNRTEEEILFDYRLRSNRAVVTSTIVTHSFRVHTRCTRLLTIVGHLVSRKFRGGGAMRIEILIFIRFVCPRGRRGIRYYMRFDEFIPKITEILKIIRFIC